MSEINMKNLQKNWVHSFEEDAEGNTVYRPDTFNFPRSRGRVSMELKENGILTDSQPGRNDVPVSVSGDWQLDGTRLVIKYHNNESGQTYSIQEVDNEKLVLKKE